MFGTIISFVAGLLGKLLGGLFGKKDPSPVELATKAATASTELAQESARVAIDESASGARADAQSNVVRIVTNTPAAADANAKLREQFPDDFRD